MWSGAQVASTPPAGGTTPAQAAGPSTEASRYVGGINAVMTPLDMMDQYVNDIARDYPNKRDFARVAEEVARNITDGAKKRAFRDAAGAKVAQLPETTPPAPRTRPARQLRQGGAPAPHAGSRETRHEAEEAARPGTEPPTAPPPQAEEDPAMVEMARRAQDLKGQIDILDNSSDNRSLNDADSRFSYAKSDEVSKRSAVRQSEEAVEAYKKKREEHINGSIKALAEKLKVSEQSLRAMWDMARFHKEKWDRDLYHSLKQAIIELVGQNRQALNEILRVFHAICMKMTDSQLGTRTSASCVFQQPQYFRASNQAVDKWSEGLAQARAQQGNFDAEVKQFEKIKNEKYYDELVVDARKKLSEAEAEHSKAAALLETAERQKLAEAKAYQEHRDMRSGLMTEYNDLVKTMQEINMEEKKKAAAAAAAAAATAADTDTAAT